MNEQDTHPTGHRTGAYTGEGIWSYCPFREQARELSLAPALAAQLQRAEDFCRDRLPDLFEHTGLSAPGGTWQVFPDRQLFKLTTASGRSWYARYALLASWRAESHSWLWSWAFPPAWNTPPELLSVAQRMRLEGAREGWDLLTEPSLLANEDEAWRLGALAAQSAGMPLVYCAGVGGGMTHVYAIDTPSWMS